MNALLKIERFSPVSYVDAYLVARDLGAHARQLGLAILTVIGVVSPATTQLHARSRSVVRWPELVLHYVVATLISLISRDGATKSALGRAPRVVAAITFFTLIVWGNIR